MKLKKVFVFLFFFFVTSSSMVFAQYPESVERAFETMDAGDMKMWAYTIQTEMQDKVIVEHFDPMKTEREKWQLISINGQEPTDDELKEYDKRKKEEIEQQKKGQDEEGKNEEEKKTISLGLNKMIDKNGLTLIKKEVGREEYSFQPQAENNDDDKMMKYLRGKLIINTEKEDKPFIEQLLMYSEKPFSPVFSVKIARFHTDMRFKSVAEEGPIFPHIIKTEIQGKAMIFKTIDELVTVTYSNFEYRGVPEENPVVKSETMESSTGD